MSKYRIAVALTLLTSCVSPTAPAEIVRGTPVRARSGRSASVR